MEPIEMRSNFEKPPIRRNKNKRLKRVFLTCLYAVISVIVLAGAYLSYKYFFPSDKQLFVLAHYNTYQDGAKAETNARFAKQTDASLTVGDGVMEPQMAKAVNGLTVCTDTVQLSENQSRLNFALKFMGGDLVTATSVTDGGVTVFSSPQMADAAYSGGSTGEILSVLLGAQGVNPDRGILDGVDREGFFKYLKKYGIRLYNDVPDAVFSSVKINGTTTVQLSAKAVRLFSGVVGQLRTDSELKSFLYAQREQIARNINGMYEPSALLVSSVTQKEFEQEYLETLDSFLADMAQSDAEVELTAVINKHRRVERETLKIAGSGTPVAEVEASGGKAVRATAYKTDGSELLHFEREQNTAGTVTDAVTAISLDLAKPGDAPKLVNVTVNTSTDTAVKDADISPPEQFYDLSALDGEEKQKLAESVNQRLTGVFTRAALGFFMFRR